MDIIYVWLHILVNNNEHLLYLGIKNANYFLKVVRCLSESHKQWSGVWLICVNHSAI